jgi:hypothetical protein
MIDRRTFLAERSPTYGAANPSRMDRPFWVHMVRTGESASAARQAYAPDADLYDGGPTWCFDRFGPTRTRMTNGTVVCIGGEHEDHYDPDFCIYNDVIVVSACGADIAIFGYPKDVFPPTDFHTATLRGEMIIVIGGLGYANERGGDRTPIYQLQVGTWRINPLPATGPSPGWLYDHEAELLADGETIRVWDGKRIEGAGRDEQHVANPAVHELHVPTATWRPRMGPPPAPRDDPAATEWPPPWRAIEVANARFPLYDLRRSVPPGHPLFATDVRPLAERGYSGVTLFRLIDGTNRVAEVHPPGEQLRHATLPEPMTTFYATLDTWRAAAASAGRPVG